MHALLNAYNFKFLFLITVAPRIHQTGTNPEVKLGSQGSLAHNLYFITGFQT